jgi:hypothetical protein
MMANKRVKVKILMTGIYLQLITNQLPYHVEDIFSGKLNRGVDTL